jgi:signal transduction histidine kinase
MSRKFSLDDLKLLTSVGAQLRIAVENARLYESKLRSERLTAVGQAVAELGHCIKNILNGMEGGSFILEKGLGKDDKTTIRKGWSVLKRNNSRLKDLVLDMLDYSKPREPVWEPVSVNRVLWDLVELIKEKAAAKKVDLMFEPDETLGEVMIDSKAIYRAILNLLTNAVDACPPQEGKVSLKTLLLPGGKSYQIIVSDNGSGIAPENLAKLGRAFFSTKGSQGTGLGLSVVYKIVEEHKGQISVESEVGKGTTFKITLQVQKPDSK